MLPHPVRIVGTYGKEGKPDVENTAHRPPHPHGDIERGKTVGYASPQTTRL